MKDKLNLLLNINIIAILLFSILSVNIMTASAATVTKTHTIDTRDKANGTYDNGVVWDTEYDRISLGGYLFKDDFSTYPVGTTRPSRWDDFIVDDKSVIRVNEHQNLLLERKGDKGSVSGGLPSIRAKFNKFTSGEAKFSITPIKKGSMRVSLFPKNLKNMYGHQFTVRLEPENKNSDKYVVIVGSNENADRNGTIDDPRAGFVVPYSTLAKKYGLPKDVVNSRYDINISWTLNGGIDVTINNKLIVKNMWKNIISDNTYLDHIGVSVATAHGYDMSGAGYVHNVELKQRDSLSGTYTSKNNDISFSKARKGMKATVDWNQSNLSGTDVELQTSVRKSGGSWSAWKKVSNDGNIPDFPKLEDGYIRYRVKMKTDDAQKSPWIKNIRFRIHGDTTPPSGKFFPNSHDWTKDTGRTTFTPSDTESGVSHYRTRISSDGGRSYNEWTNHKGDTGTNFTFHSSGKFVVQAQVYDSAGNSKTITSGEFRVDKVSPTGTIIPSTDTWTNKDVILNVQGTDAHSGIKRIKLPDGSWVGNSTVSYTASENGTYTFTFEDSVGHTVTESIKVTNIDKTSPTGTITQTPTSWTKENVTLTAKGSDKESGIKRIKLPNGTWKNGTTGTHIVSENGTYTFTFEDNAGNTSTKSIEVTNIDKTNPKSSITQNPISWTKNNVTLTAKGSDKESGMKRIQTPNGKWINGSSTTYTVKENGTYAFVFEDKVGNTTKESIKVTNIDKINPGGIITQNPTIWTKGKVTLTAKGSDGQSGMKRIKDPGNTWTTGSQAIYTVSKNGTYSFIFEDVAGNKTTKSIKVTNIDSSKPTITVTGNPNDWTNKDVTLRFEAQDNQSGLSEVIYPDGSTQSFNNGTSTQRGTYLVKSNGDYKFTIQDQVGNTQTETIKVRYIDKVAPAKNKIDIKIK